MINEQELISTIEKETGTKLQKIRSFQYQETIYNFIASTGRSDTLFSITVADRGEEAVLAVRYNISTKVVRLLGELMRILQND